MIFLRYHSLLSDHQRTYTLKLCAAVIILVIWSAVQGIISFQIGSTFNSPCLVAFGISSFAQLVIILYLYHKLLTEHYGGSLINTGTLAIELLEIESYIDSRRGTEKSIATFGMIIFIIFATITTFVAFDVIKQEKDHPKEPLPPGTIPPFNINSSLLDDTNDDAISLPPWQLLAFSIYVLHPYLILIPFLWYLSNSKQSTVLKEATIWAVLFFSIAYITFISNQLLYFMAWKLQEVIFTLIIAVIFLACAANFGWIYWWSEIGNIESEICYSSEIEDLEEE